MTVIMYIDSVEIKAERKNGHFQSHKSLTNVFKNLLINY